MPRDGFGRGAAPGFASLPASLLIASLLAASCAGGTPFPWPASAQGASKSLAGKTNASAHAEVTTANSPYDRSTSQALVRRIDRPTRANLDYAAYHANFMNADPEPEGLAAAAGKRPDTTRPPFGGALEPSTLTGAIAATPLTEDERRQPLAFAPLVELLVSKHVPGGDKLEDVGAAVRAEDYGLGGGPQAARQIATEIYLHDGAPGKPLQIWIKIELAPWFKAFSGMTDEDGDGFREIYGRVPAASLGASVADVAAFIRDDYAGRLLSPAEVKGWAHQLASYWYPSYNTDLVAPAAAWPDADTEPAVRAELGAQRFDHPTIVMRGKPQGKPVYNVFLVAGAGDDAAGEKAKAAAALPPLALPRSQPAPEPGPVAAAVRAELAAHGGSWARWNEEVAPLHATIKRDLGAIRPGAKAMAGSDGFLFFKQSLAYVVGGDLGKQKGAKNPITAIVAFKALLAAHGVDLLFVPVPTKVEVYADKLGAPKGARAGGAAATATAGAVANPFERKLLLDLADAGVETIDLLPLFLRERTAESAGKPAGGAAAEPLYQRQDTHWTSRGLELAARAVADRIKRYSWYPPIAKARRRYAIKDAPFSRHGDLVSRLADADRGKLQPESLVGHQVVGRDGALYDDDDGSPIVVLGDSFTGVFELMDCEHAGVSAHVAKEIGYPVDLVMSYGGGPNVRQKLLRRGADALGKKKLVVWMMTARDLYDFWEGWQPLAEK